MWQLKTRASLAARAAGLRWIGFGLGRVGMESDLISSHLIAFHRVASHRVAVQLTLGLVAFLEVSSDLGILRLMWFLQVFLKELVSQSTVVCA
jgi:hypothetical protein